METKSPNKTNHPSLSQTNPLNISQDTSCNISHYHQTFEPDINKNTSNLAISQDQQVGHLSESILVDPTLLIGLSKAQNNLLSWIAHYNEGEPPENSEPIPQSINEIQVGQSNKKKRVDGRSQKEIRA